MIDVSKRTVVQHMEEIYDHVANDNANLPELQELLDYLNFLSDSKLDDLCSVSVGNAHKRGSWYL